MINTAAEIETLAASVPDNGGVYFVPALTGLGAHWDQYARGAILGITRGTNRTFSTTLEGCLSSIRFSKINGS
jgi:glycerol kinase